MRIKFGESMIANRRLDTVLHAIILKYQSDDC